jgi:diguanylate cyclase (GGDEF)-like protein
MGSASGAASAVVPTTAVLLGTGGLPLPDSVATWLAARSIALAPVGSADELLVVCTRGRPRFAVFDMRASPGADLADAIRRLKRDSYTAVVPAVVLVAAAAVAVDAVVAFEAGADEVLSTAMGAMEVTARLSALLSRSDRDTAVHPSTRLPGAPEIECEYSRRIAAGERFAVCYVDLDHFKEFNDRYSYQAGDRVIRLLAKILHDIVKGVCGERGFVGHIGGDDFICVTPEVDTVRVCGDIVDVFDELIPWQYSTQDRTTGYYFGKDRRGHLHRVPLMTVSIGVVTNASREFTHPAQISELATEMKSYAKTFSGSIYVQDRRSDGVAEPSGTVPGAATTAGGER